MSNEERESSSLLTERFHEFLVQHSPSAFSRLLRRVLLEYIVYRHGLGFPVNFSTQVTAFSDFFDLLDAAADEYDVEEGDNKERED